MSQFVMLPPLQRIAALFTIATGRRLESDVTWAMWHPVSPDQLQWLTAFIRPCHQGLLVSAISGDPILPLLRQLLRPYDYRIEAGVGTWTLHHGKREAGVRIKPGKTVTFNLN